jgi:hypothetical protein
VQLAVLLPGDDLWHRRAEKGLPHPGGLGPKLGCYGLTEAGAGSDPASLRTTAVLDGDEWVLNGEKKFITNGNVASYAVMAAVTDKERAPRASAPLSWTWKTPRDFPWAGWRKRWASTPRAPRSWCSRTPAFPRKTCWASAARASADAHHPGFGPHRHRLPGPGHRPGRAGRGGGIRQAREQFGKPISAFQAIQWKLADMAAALDAAELLLLRAAWMEDQHVHFEKQAAMAKMFASDAAMNAAVEGVQILGGYGYTREYPMERHMRDAKITQIYEGTNEIMRLVIARNLTLARLAGCARRPYATLPVALKLRRSFNYACSFRLPVALPMAPWPCRGRVQTATRYG